MRHRVGGLSPHTSHSAIYRIYSLNVFFFLLPIKDKLVSNISVAKTKPNFLMGVVPEHLEPCQLNVYVKLRF
jgi:hypothetical protein